MIYKDRKEAGRVLAGMLKAYAGPDTVILGIPRGGVVVAAEIARALGAKLDVAVARKVSTPHNPELAIAAVAPGNVFVVNPYLLERLQIPEEKLKEYAEIKAKEAEERLNRYRRGHDEVPLEGRVAIITDDGIATGLTVEAAVRSIRLKNPSRILLASPVASREAAEYLRPLVEEFICPVIPRDFYAVGQFYWNFTQVTDEEVIAILDEFRLVDKPDTKNPGGA